MKRLLAEYRRALDDGDDVTPHWNLRMAKVKPGAETSASYRRLRTRGSQITGGTVCAPIGRTVADQSEGDMHLLQRHECGATDALHGQQGR